MGFLTGKRILITGLLSNRSIAYGIAKAFLNATTQLLLYNRRVHNILCEGAKNQPDAANYE